MFHRPHKRITASVGTRSRTKQSHKDECDINNILNQYKRTGIMAHVRNARPTYGDLPSDLDFQTASNILIQAEQAFDGLPAIVRDHFRNDPERFLAAFSDPEQAEALTKFGLIGPRPEPAPVRPSASIGLSTGAAGAKPPNGESGGGAGG